MSNVAVSRLAIAGGAAAITLVSKGVLAVQ